MNSLEQIISIKNYDELTKEINRCRSVVTAETLTYWNSLVDLKFSVLQDKIDRTNFVSLEIYREIAKYNLCYRTLALLQKEKFDLKVMDSNTVQGISIALQRKDKVIPIFDFRFYDTVFRDQEIGRVYIYDFLYSEKIRKYLKEIVEKKLNMLYKGKNLEIKKVEIRYYQILLERLKIERKLSNEEKETLKTMHYIHELLSNDFEITWDQSIDSNKIEEILQYPNQKEYLYLMYKNYYKSAGYFLQSAKKSENISQKEEELSLTFSKKICDFDIHSRRIIL